MHEKAYGTWTSSITPATLSGDDLKIAYPQSLGGKLFWQESLISESRTTVMSLDVSEPRSMIPSPFEVSTQANIYGGQAWAPTRDGVVFVNKSDQGIYLAPTEGEPTPLLCLEHHSFADFAYCEASNRLLFVVEDRSVDGFPDACLGLIDLDSGEYFELARTHNFYAFPRWHPNGSTITWMQWDIESMSWDHSQIYRANLEAKSLSNIAQVSSDDAQAVFQPSFCPDGTLHYVSDLKGWWNIYSEACSSSPLIEEQAEYGRPVWLYGWSTYAFVGDRIYALRCVAATWELVIIESGSNEITQVALPFALIEDVVAHGQGVAFIGHCADQSSVLATWSADAGLEVVRTQYPNLPSQEWISTPKHIEIVGQKAKTYGFFYPPKNPHYAAAPGELPPLILLAHGGPTAATHGVLNLKIQYWTSRGYAVFDVNYRGSTGYGTSYRKALNQQWGVADVEDLAAAAQYAIDHRLADPERIVMKGGSAGGYSMLKLAADFDVLKAGACYYGVSDLFALDEHTHKFEACYNAALIGQRPEANAIYEARSPINLASEIDAPVIFMQGLKDFIVSPEQSTAMLNKLIDNDVSCEYFEFPEEGHSFKRAETIDTTLKAEHNFYAKCFGFDVAEADRLASNHLAFKKI